MGRGAETRKSVVDKHVCFRDDGGQYDRHANRTALCAFQKEFQDSSLHLQSSRTNARLRGRKNAKCKQCLVAGCYNLQKLRRAVEGKV